MRLGCTAVLLGLVVLLAALSFLTAVGTPPPLKRAPPTPSPTPLPDTYLPRVGSLNRFRRSEADGVYYLTYGFVDHHGRRHDMTCAIDRAGHERAVASFGYRKADVREAARARMQPWVDRQVRSRGLQDVLRVKVNADLSYTWTWTLPDDLEGPSRSSRRDEIEAFAKWLAPAYEREDEAVLDAAYRERGFKLTGHTIEPDYAGVVQGSAGLLDDCFRNLENAGKGYTRRQELGLFLALLQEIRYEVPPDEMGGRDIFGFYVPTEVLVNDHGDCDSKSAAFAALWRHLDTPLILISVPHHMLVGVEVTPGPGEAFVRIGNRYFVLCEPAGPAKLHPGETRLAGEFEYALLEPGRTGDVEGRAVAR